MHQDPQTNEAQWTAVDAYITGRLIRPDDVFRAVLAANAAAGLPAIDVSPLQGQFLHLIARIAAARRILEIGTLGGYSTIWLARAIPADGIVVTLEENHSHAAVARANFARAGLASRIDLREGPALDTLPSLEADGIGPFDLIFIDADKEHNPDYLSWAMRLGRSGSVIIGDNVVREGTILTAENADPTVSGVRRFLDLLADEPRLSATAIQTVGSKGWDGFALAVLG
ncbi:MAG: O-methyltransferase [Acetobacteraceae bacterium]